MYYEDQENILKNLGIPLEIYAPKPEKKKRQKIAASFVGYDRGDNYYKGLDWGVKYTGHLLNDVIYICIDGVFYGYGCDQIPEDYITELEYTFNIRNAILLLYNKIDKLESRLNNIQWSVHN